MYNVQKNKNQTYLNYFKTPMTLFQFLLTSKLYFNCAFFDNKMIYVMQ